MTVNQLITELNAQALSLPDSDREVTGCYCGDLLSWVMGRAKNGDAWVTIMSNINVPAVASLADTACVIIAENARPDDEVIKVAESKDVNIILVPDSAYEVCVKLGKLI